MANKQKTYYEPGTIVLAHFTPTTGSGTFQRHALVVEDKGDKLKVRWEAMAREALERNRWLSSTCTISISDVLRIGQ